MQIRIAILGLILAGALAGCDSKPEPGPCVPDCEGKQCGDDGCGGSCGGCQPDQLCDANHYCVCAPDCAGKECGDDGCGQTCGACPPGESCDPGGQCQPGCTPDCDARECGDDGCQGSCGTCGAGELCQANGQCVCVRDCAGKNCGDDGCGGSCGVCLSCHGEPAPFLCHEAHCEYECCSDCGARECGLDPICGSEPCGTCTPPETCNEPLGVCQCVPDCSDRECGPDPICGQSCGTCEGVMICGYHSDFSSCDYADYPCCESRECGYDPCTGTMLCGSCAEGYACDGSNRCVPAMQQSGEPCTHGEVNAGAGPCMPGLDCVGAGPDPEDMPCPGGQSDCLEFLEEGWNPDCVNGGCGASFCAAPCVDGGCEDCFNPITAAGGCYCLAADGPGVMAPGNPCPFGLVNAEPCYGQCAAGLICLGQNASPGYMPCISDEDCLAFFPGTWNVDCESGACGMSYCATECVAGECEDPGFEPFDISGTCYCRPSP